MAEHNHTLSSKKEWDDEINKNLLIKKSKWLDSVKKLIPNKNKNKNDDGSLIVGGNQSARTYKSSATEQSVMNDDGALKARGNQSARTLLKAQSARTYKSSAKERSVMNRYVRGAGVVILPERTKTTYTASVKKK
eukprot:CAMPEP_0170780480 /NCGR_PEP_ID=MMETSP0733-20121128/13629_1 /TAXON_ID=186038 /ORGANISM="Fragilariopsis kerguelensis, Strain L26-C5" /LENGTH=134 /DNA_ID=CAMNT_0011124337 /DNA_START=133 /DNA_END=537 /DNA_ORIENTATION=+